MKKSLMLVVVFLAVTSAVLAATPPQYVNYQSILRDASGNPLTGTYDMTFSFYDALSGGSLLLSDAHLASGTGAVTVDNGLFNVPLGGGSLTPGVETTLAGVFANHSAVYLELQVGSETLSPRVPVRSAAFAQNAHALDGQPVTAFALASHTHDAADIVSGTIPAARGGTGLADPGPSGNVLTSNGTSWASTALQPFSGAAPGLVPASSGGTANFLRADGAWATPPFSGLPGGVSGDIQTNNGSGGFAGGTQLSSLVPYSGGTNDLVLGNHKIVVEGQSWPWTPALSSTPYSSDYGPVGVYMAVADFSGVKDPIIGWGYNNVQEKANHPRLYWNLEGYYYDAVNNHYWSETYLERTDSNGVMHRPFAIGTYDGHSEAGFNVDSLNVASRTGSGILSIVPSQIIVNPGNALYFMGNNVSSIFQQNTGGTYNALCKLDNSNRWQLSPDSLPLDLMGTTTSFVDGSNNRWAWTPVSSQLQLGWYPSGGSATNYFQFDYTNSHANFSLLGAGDANQIMAPNGYLRIYSNASNSVLIGNSSANINVAGNVLTLASLISTSTGGEIQWKDTSDNVTYRLESSQAEVGQSWALKWRNNTDARNGTADVSISRLGTNILGIGDGGANANGSLNLANLTADGAIQAATAKLTGLPTYSNNAAALGGGLSAGMLYRNGGDPDLLCIVYDTAPLQSKTKTKASKQWPSAGTTSTSGSDSGVNSTILTDADGNVYGKSFRSSDGQLGQIVQVSTPVEAGDVLVADRDHAGQMRLSQDASDPAVVGVVAGTPGLLLGACKPPCEGQQGASSANIIKAPIAFSGVVLCKVDATQSPVSVGDLLVTSPNPGYAMSAINPFPGTVVAKALEPLASGTGLIKVLVMLR